MSYTSGLSHHQLSTLSLHRPHQNYLLSIGIIAMGIPLSPFLKTLFLFFLYRALHLSLYLLCAQTVPLIKLINCRFLKHPFLLLAPWNKYSLMCGVYLHSLLITTNIILY